MSTNLADEIAAKAAALAPAQQREVLRVVDALLQHSESESQQDPYTLPPLVADETERARLLREIVQEMKNHPLSGNPPHLTRDELHGRRLLRTF